MVEFSIIIPVYNKSKSIVSTIESVLNQTYSNFELVIIDDGSTDDSLSKIYTFNDPRMFVYSQPNKGVSSARNNGISKSQNPWIVFLDADDLFELNALSIFVEMMATLPSYSVYAANMIYGNSTRCRVKCHTPLVSINPYKDWWNMYLSLEIGAYTFHRDVLSQVGLFDAKLFYYEDLDFAIRIMDKFPIVLSSLPVKIYRKEYSELSVIPHPIERDFAYYLNRSNTGKSFWRNIVLAYNVWDTRRNRLLYNDRLGYAYYTKVLFRSFPLYICLYFELLSLKQYWGKIKRKIFFIFFRRNRNHIYKNEKDNNFDSCL